MTSSPQQRPTATLTVTEPSGSTRTVPIDSLPFRMGRQADNDLVIRDSRASRNHARIVEENGQHVIEDLRSTHGTLVNGEAVERRPLHSGDVISFGFEDSYRLTYTAAGAELHRLLNQISHSGEQSPAGAENLARLRSVLDVARALQSSLSTENVLDAVIDAALTITGTQRGFLLLREDDDDLRIRVARDQRGERISGRDLKVPTRLIERALHQRSDLLTMNFDPAAEQGLKPDLSVAELELRSVVCVPLVRVRTGDFQKTVHTPLNQTLGLLYLDSQAGSADLSSGNRELLQTLALEASTIIENARLLDEERAKQKLDEEMRLARTIQQSLLPKHLPESGWFRAAGSSIAAHEVGGDYFDAIPVRDDCWAVVVADVCGKGVSSALLASLLQGAFLRGAETPEQIRTMFSRLNRFLLERTEGEKYATLVYGVLTGDGTLRWANAAHCPPIVARASGKIERLQPTGMPVGMLDIADWEVQMSLLSPGDKLVLYSDGLTEARDPAGHFYTEQRLLDAVREHRALGCRSLEESLLTSVRAFTRDAAQNDDITLVVVEYQTE